jgi:Na+/H+ antiporter NhaD/arsenite permease-like protein
MEFTANGFGLASLLLFVAAYAVVMAEERFHIRKSIPVMIAAGAIWILVAAAYAGSGSVDGAAEAVRHNILEFAELFLFLLAAVTFVNTMEERQVFDALRGWLVERKLSLRALFWLTGLLAFVISPIADNLTTALVMGAVVMAIAGDNSRFVTIACVNLAVAANAGGAFSPFGDITTLMVWQHGSVPFTGFFHLLLPSVVNWLVPAAIMSFAVGSQAPPSISERVRLRPGALVVIALFIATIVLTVALHQFLHLPAALGMMTGLGVLNLYATLARRSAVRKERAQRLQLLQAEQLRQEAQLESGEDDGADYEILSGFAEPNDPGDTFDIFHIMERVEWDTLMFFYGVVLCVGGLGALGYLSIMSHELYGGLGPTSANVLVGVLSAIVDNIPIMFAVLSMNPEMSTNQWLLVTLTAGVGGSLLSIGSAAGVALMGHARGSYTFMSHLKWTWAVALGYAASIGVHLLVNGR